MKNIKHWILIINNGSTLMKTEIKLSNDQNHIKKITAVT